MSHTLQEVIDLAVKTAVLKAHPVGSYWITETDDDPNIIFGGGMGTCSGQVLAMLR